MKMLKKLLKHTLEHNKKIPKETQKGSSVLHFAFACYWNNYSNSHSSIDTECFITFFILFSQTKETITYIILQ